MFYAKTRHRDQYGDKPKRSPILLPLIQTIDDINSATTMLLDLLAKGDITTEDVEPINKMLAEKRNVLEATDFNRRLLELQKKGEER
jgi:hypothetical protein